MEKEFLHLSHVRKIIQFNISFLQSFLKVHKYQNYIKRSRKG